MAANPARKRDLYTYEDYKSFPDDLRCKIIDGEVYDMTPAQITPHQDVTGEIFRVVGNHLKKATHISRDNL